MQQKMARTIQRVLFLTLICNKTAYCSNFTSKVTTSAPHLNNTDLGNSTNSTQPASCRHVGINIVGDDYNLDVWPRHAEIRHCNDQLDPIIKANDVVPRPCAMLIYITVKLVDLQKIDLDANHIYMKILYKEYWHDDRIILPPPMTPACRVNATVLNELYLEPKQYYLDSIWTPDFFMSGVMDSRTIEFGKESSGLILHSSRYVENFVTLSMALMCHMNFQFYPFDTQTCNLTIESFGINSDDVAMVWNSPGVEVLSNFVSSGYHVTVTPHEPSIHRYDNASYPQLTVTISFRRQRLKYFFLLFLPSILHFAIAWLAFFLPKEVSQGRCIINCSTTLSLVSMISVLSRNSPHGGFTKAMDIWCFFSIIFQSICLMDAMIDTRLLYTATNIKEHAEHEEIQQVLSLVTDNNWLAKEVRVIRTQDEGQHFHDTMRDVRRMVREKQQETAADLEGFERSSSLKAKQNRYWFRYSPRYYRFLKLMVVYQGWSQYVVLTCYLLFMLTYCAVYTVVWLD